MKYACCCPKESFLLPGGGSTFHFTAELKIATHKKQPRALPSPLAGKSVLVGDDNSASREIVLEMLRKSDMRTEAASCGEEALRKLNGDSADAFAVCIVDLRLPDMSGFELAKKIRQPGSESPTLLAFTAMPEVSAAQCREAGFDGFLPKPIRRHKLISMLERLANCAHPDTAACGVALLTQHSLREELKHAVSILLVEDNPVNQKLAVMLLEKAGYGVTVAQNGREAIEIFSSAPQRFDIVLMDIQMPELNGYDATRELRSRGFTEMPVIAMTANALKGDRERCLDAGMNDYIAQPIKREDVYGKIEKWVFR